MASASDIKIRTGHATPSTIVLRAPVTPDAAAPTAIILRGGSATASTVILRGAAAPVAGGPHEYAIIGAGVVTLSGTASMLEGRGIIGVGVITISGAAAMIEGRGIVGAGVIALSGAAALEYTAATVVDEPAPYVMPYTRNSDGPGITETPRKPKPRPVVERPRRHYAFAGSGQITVTGAAVLEYSNNRPARDAADLAEMTRLARDLRDAADVLAMMRRAA